MSNTRASMTAGALGLVLCASLGLAGCGDGSAGRVYTGEVYPVKGKVLLPGDKPMKGGRVILLPKDPAKMAASGEIGADGSFSLKAADGREGAAHGEYKVRIEPSPEMYAGKRKTGLADPNALPFDPKFTDEEGDTGLTATVKTEPTTLPPFKLTPRGAVAASRRVTD